LRAHDRRAWPSFRLRACAAISKRIAQFPILAGSGIAGAPADHALAAATEPIPLEALAEDRFVLRPRGPGAAFFEQVFELCAHAGFVPRVVQEATEPPTILGMVAAGIGLSIAPASLQAIHVEDVVWRELALGREAVSSILLVLNTRQENSLRSQFVEIMKRNIEPEQGVSAAKRAVVAAARRL